MSTVFISYRRQTAPGEARALFNDLAAKLGKSSVFMDVDSIALGRDFRRVLQQTLESIDVLLVIIDKEWLTVKDDKGRIRLEQPGDYVRQEVEAALKRDIVVTPVLVEGAQMPAPEELPAEIRELVYRNAFELTYNRWDSDVHEMIRRLGLAPPEPAPKIETAPLPVAPQKDLSASAGPPAVRAAEAHVGGPGIVSRIWSSSFGRAFALGSAPRRNVILLLLLVVAVVGTVASAVLIFSPGGTLAPLRLTIVSAQQDVGRVFASYLKEQGAVPTIIGMNELANLSLAQPDIVVVGSDTIGHWKQHDANQLRQIFEHYKVIGVGEAGDELFRQLGVPLHDIMSGGGETLTVTNADLLKSPTRIDAEGGRIAMYKDGASNRLVGLYDMGSPDIAGFEAIARWQKFPNHWPIARKGNYLFFGLDLDTDRMTESGRNFLANLISNHKAQPWMPLTKVLEEVRSREELRRILPGLSSGVINAQLPSVRKTFQVTKPGLIKATLTWNAKVCPLTLALFGPGQAGYYARQDGESPLSFEVAVSENHIARGKEWTITIDCIANMGSHSIDYTMQLAYPLPS
jgi:hypothetical protein